MSNLPTISIVSCTYNANIELFEKVLKALRSQDYPRNLIDHIIMDGGSTNATVKLAKRYGCRVFIRKDLKDEEQERASLGFKKAKGKILLIIQSDNLVMSKNWLRKMVQPFLDNNNVFCTFTSRYGYKKDMSATTRYGALIGANDPLISPYFLDKIEKIRMTTDKYNKGEVIFENRDYYTVKFDESNFPPLGDNGQMVLKKVMDKVNKSPKEYMHLDTFAKMFDLGYDTCGVVKSSIAHVITPDLLHLVKRRIQLKEKFFDKNRKRRRYLIFDINSKKDKINLFKFIVYSTTFVVPLIQSIRGYLKIRDSAWFLHPILCFLMLVAYSYSEFAWVLRKTLGKV